MVKQLIKIILLALILIVFTVLITASTIQIISKSSIKQAFEIQEHRDFAIVLGASVYSNGRPSPIYIDRLNVAKYLYDKNLVDKIIISGYTEDYGNYDELIPAKNYLTSLSVKDNDILLDSLGHDTFKSLLNFKELYGNRKLYLVTQNYHLYRGIFISKLLKIDAIGVNADVNVYREIKNFIIREYFANLKILIDYINYKYEVLR